MHGLNAEASRVARSPPSSRGCAGAFAKFSYGYSRYFSDVRQRRFFGIQSLFGAQSVFRCFPFADLGLAQASATALAMPVGVVIVMHAAWRMEHDVAWRDA